MLKCNTRPKYYDRRIYEAWGRVPSTNSIKNSRAWEAYSRSPIQTVNLSVTNPRAFHVGFAVELEQHVLWLHQSSTVRVIASMLHVHISSTTNLYNQKQCLVKHSAKIPALRGTQIFITVFQKASRLIASTFFSFKCYRLPMPKCPKWYLPIGFSSKILSSPSQKCWNVSSRYLAKNRPF